MTATQERQHRAPHRQALRVYAQDAPWTVSVAEDPHHPSSYTLYVKTPTHNLTLSRTAREIVKLDHKLHDAYPSVLRPALPIDSSALPQPVKRKFVILNTFSRLVSPTSKSTEARSPSAAGSSVPSTLPTPVVSPKAEIADPFFGDLGVVAVDTSTCANPTITGLAAYLTTLSNDQVFRQARSWKRFVRVRTDDLESVRVERAIRRVRSDVGAHFSSPSTVNATMHNPSVLDDTRHTVTECKSRDQVSDFETVCVLGKGRAGKVLFVLRHKSSLDLYALKVITKRHVLAHQELQQTLTEQAVLRRMAVERSNPFVVKLWWSFHDKENLYLLMDFHPGGDLATQLAHWGRLGRDRVRFYAAEIVEGVEGLHAAGVIYRDITPKNILIAADGHIVLSNFSLSKEFPKRGGQPVPPGTTPVAGVPYWMKDDNKDLATWPSRQVDTTSTFCGTAEYLAPEVIQGLPYSYEVDWWSFGTILYEMLAGITPFWADNRSDMYLRVLQDELQFPDDRAMDQDTKGLIRELLQRNPALRTSEPRIKRHPYFSMIDWSHVYYKRCIPPYIPPIDPSSTNDTQNFDATFLDMEPVIDDQNDMNTNQQRQADLEPTGGEDCVATPSQSRSSSIQSPDDVFDGYLFKGQHSEVSEEEGEEEEENVTVPSIGKSIAIMSSPSAFVSALSSQGSRTTLGQPSFKAATIMSLASAFVSTMSSQGSRTALVQPSLKSKDSVVSIAGSPGSSSGGSTNGEGRPVSDADIIETVRAPQADQEYEKYRNKKLKGGSCTTLGQPSHKLATERRGRTAALPFHRKTFLRAKSPPSTSTRPSQSAGKSFTMMSDRSAGATVPSISSPQNARMTLGQPSLKSKDSVVSIAGSPGSSSGGSTNGEGRPVSDADIIETVRAPQADQEHEKYRNKKLKRGAEAVLSLFALQ